MPAKKPTKACATCALWELMAAAQQFQGTPQRGLCRQGPGQVVLVPAKKGKEATLITQVPVKLENEWCSFWEAR